ncbi:MAG TPA: hypothetical protein VGP48_14170 [Stellaceae bacterium]|jgi:hypothetical protein|nr:hypothetical protein [Stellaceae bacterium]
MPHFVASAERRPLALLLSESDVARTVRAAEEFDALLGETIDLLPLGALVRLTERSRAA